MAKKNQLLVKIFFPVALNKSSQTFQALSVSSENQLGKFDILPEHINFITLIFNKVIIQTVELQKIEFQFQRGVLIVRENTVRIFVGL